RLPGGRAALAAAARGAGAEGRKEGRQRGAEKGWRGWADRAGFGAHEPRARRQRARRQPARRQPACDGIASAPAGGAPRTPAPWSAALTARSPAGHTDPAHVAADRRVATGRTPDADDARG